MPFYVQKLPGHLEIAEAIYKRCWYPKRCFYSKKILWLKKAYYISCYNQILEKTYPIVYTWIDKDTFITMILKGEI